MTTSGLWRLTVPELDDFLATHPGWRRASWTLVREAVFRDFESALSFVEAVGQAAVDYKRRPDICISEFNHVRLTVVNQRHAGFTPAELRLAAKIDAFLTEDQAADA